MEIQVAIANIPYASALRELLIRNGSDEVRCVDVPDPTREGLMVLDPEHLECLPVPLSNPDRVVLIAHNDPASLSRAWEVGVNSVVFENDSMNTAVLAIMGARLRAAKHQHSGRKSPDRRD